MLKKVFRGALSKIELAKLRWDCGIGRGQTLTTRAAPLASAYHQLQRIDLGPERDSGLGPVLHPGDNPRYVNAKDMLSLSFL